jgi:hypothetical protein
MASYQLNRSVHCNWRAALFEFRKLMIPVFALGIGVPGMLSTLKASIFKRSLSRSVSGTTLNREVFTVHAHGRREDSRRGRHECPRHG